MVFNETMCLILASTHQLLRLMDQDFLVLYNMISTFYFHQFIVHLLQSSSNMLAVSEDFFTTDKGYFTAFNTKHLQFYSCKGGNCNEIISGRNFDPRAEIAKNI